MINIGKGNKYYIDSDQIIIVPKDGSDKIKLVPYPNEDFSVFELGPEINKNSIVEALLLQVGNKVFRDVLIHVQHPKPGEDVYIKIYNNKTMDLLVSIYDIILRNNI